MANLEHILCHIFAEIRFRSAMKFPQNLPRLDTIILFYRSYVQRNCVRSFCVIKGNLIPKKKKLFLTSSHLSHDTDPQTQNLETIHPRYDE